MKRYNKIILLSLMSSFLFSSNVYARSRTYLIDGKNYSFDPNSIKLYVNEKLMDNSLLNSIIYQNSLYTSVRTIFGDLGAEISYDSKTREATVNYKDNIVVLKSNNNRVIINNQIHVLDAPVKIIDDRMMVPARALSETLGLRVDWDDSTRSAFIDEVLDLEALEETEEVLLEDEEILLEESQPMGAPEEEIISEETSDEPSDNPNMYETEEDKNEANPVYIIGNSAKINDLSMQILEPTNYVQTSIEAYAISEDVFTLNLKNSLSNVTRYISDGSNLVMDIDNCIIPEELAIRNGLNNQLIKAFTIKPLYSNPPKARVIIEMYEGSSFMVKYSVDRKTIDVEIESPRNAVVKEAEPAEVKKEEAADSVVYADNVHYDEVNRRIVLKKVAGKNIDISQIVHKDLYTSNKYVLDLGANLSDVYANATYSVESEFVSSFTVTDQVGSTEIIINEYKIVVCLVEEDNNNYYIYLKGPKEVYPLIVILDPGHGGEDPGAVGNGLREKDLNTDIGNRIYELINQNPNMKAYFTKTEDYKMPLSERAYFANRNGDIFISIHNNSNTKTSPRGTEVYYYRHYNDSDLGFSSRELAQIMVNSISEKLGSNNRGVFENAYTVIQKTEVPACLLEIGFISNAQEAALLATPEYRQKAAEGVYEAILKVYDRYKPAR